MAFGSDRRWRRIVLAMVSGVIVVSGLGGCAMRSSLTPLEARDRVQSAPDVTKATVTTGTDRESLKTTYFVDVRVTIRGSESSTELTQLVDYVTRVGWATDIGHQPTGVQLLLSGPGSPDVIAALDELGLKGYPGPRDNSSALITAKDLEQKWGKWPGEVPDQIK
jgi:hypothetical protein